MEISIREHFIEMWEKYFGHAELPVTCYYSDSDMNVKIVGKPSGHSCLLAQLTSVRRGESLCFQEESVNCGGGKRYLGFAEQISNRFEYFLSNGEDGGVCERYKQSPGLVRSLLKSLPRLDLPGKNLIFKRWDKLEDFDNPQVITFFVTPEMSCPVFLLWLISIIMSRIVSLPRSEPAVLLLFIILLGNSCSIGNVLLSDCSILLPGNA